MTVLDTFVSIFTADSSELRKGYNEGEKAVDDLVDSLEKAESTAENTTKSLIGLAKKAAGFIAGAIVANKTVQQAISDAADVSALKSFSDSVDSSIEDVDAFARGLMRVGSSRSDAEATLSSINGNLDKIKGNSKNAIEGLLNVAGQVERMDVKKAKEYLATIGITDRKVIDQILKGRSSLESMMRTQKELGVTTKDTAERADAFHKALGGMNEGFDRVKKKVSDAILPAMTWVVDAISKGIDFVFKYKHFFIGAFIAISSTLLAVYMPTIISAAAATWALIAPIIAAAAPFIALAAIFALVYDEIMNFIEGNDTLASQILSDYPVIGDVFEFIFDIFKKVFDFLASALRGAVQMFDIFVDFVKSIPQRLLSFSKSFSEVFQNPIDSIAKGFDWLKNKISTVIDGIMSAINGIKDAWGTVKGFFGFEDEQEVESSVTVKATREFKDYFETPEAKEERARIARLEEKQWNEDPSLMGFGYALQKEEVNNVVNQVSNEENSNQYFNNDTKNIAMNTIQTADKNPLNAVTTNAMTTQNITKESRVDIQQITINTQATDADGIAAAVNDSLASQLKDLSYESSSGRDR